LKTNDRQFEGRIHVIKSSTIPEHISWLCRSRDLTTSLQWALLKDAIIGDWSR